MMKHMYCYKIADCNNCCQGVNGPLKLIGYLNPVDKRNENITQEVSVVTVQHVARKVFFKIARKAFAWQQMDEIENLLSKLNIPIIEKQCGRFELHVNGKFEYFSGSQITVSWTESHKMEVGKLQYTDKHWCLCKSPYEEFHMEHEFVLPAWFELKSPVEIASDNENVRLFTTKSTADLSTFVPEDDGKICFSFFLHTYLEEQLTEIQLPTKEPFKLSDHFKFCNENIFENLKQNSISVIKQDNADCVRMVLRDATNETEHFLDLAIKINLFRFAERNAFSKSRTVAIEVIHWFIKSDLANLIYNHCYEEKIDLEFVCTDGLVCNTTKGPTYHLLHKYDTPAKKSKVIADYKTQMKVRDEQIRKLWSNFGRDIAIETLENSNFKGVPQGLSINCQFCAALIDIEYCTTEDEEEFSLDFCPKCGANPTPNMEVIVNHVNSLLLDMIVKYDKEIEKEPFFSQLLQYRQIFNIKQALEQSTGEQRLAHVSKPGFRISKEKHDRLFNLINQELEFNRYSLKPFKYL